MLKWPAGNTMDITLFIPCLVDQFSPRTGSAVTKILTGLGHNVRYIKEQTCCGQPAFNSGYREEAAALAERFIRLFSSEKHIVSPSGSCVSMVKNHYRSLELDESLAVELESLEKRIFEFSEFLVNVLDVDRIECSLNARVTYHDSCHLLRELGVEEEPRKLLRNVEGLEFVEMNDSGECCGFGGVFAARFPEISTSMAADKVKNIMETGADYVTGCDAGCLIHIQGYADRNGLPVRTVHLAEILAGEVRR